MGWIAFYAIGLVVIIALMVGAEEWQPRWLIGIVVITVLLLRSIFEYVKKGRTSGGGGADRAKTAAGRAAVASRAAALLKLPPRQEKALVYIYEHNSITIDDFARLCPDADRPSLEQDLQAMVGLKLMVFKDDKFIIT